MIHTYKRKGTSLNACSFYERLCGEFSAECSARATNIEARLPNGCFPSRDNEKAKCEEWSESELSSSSKIDQSQPSDTLDAPPIMFKYTRRPKELRKSGRSLQHVDVSLLIQEEGQSISKIDTTQPDLDRLFCDPCSLDLCGNYAMRACGSLPSQNFRKEENHLDRVCSNMSAHETTNRHKTDPQGRDTEDSSLQNCAELGGLNCAASVQTYSRRSMDSEDSRRPYAALMAERSTFLACDLSISKNAESPVHQAVLKTMELSISDVVDGHSRLFCQSLGKLTDRVSSVGNMICSQGNQKVRNGRPLFDDTDVSTVPSINDEAVTGQPDDTIKPHHPDDLYLHTASEEPSTNTVMEYESDGIIDNSQNPSDDPEKAGAASKEVSCCAISLDCSVLEVSSPDKRSKVDLLNLAARTKVHEALPLQLEPLHQSPEKIQAASVYAEVPRANSKEILETMSERIKETDCLFDINVEPSKDAVSASPKNKMADKVASPNDSTQAKILQLFPEDPTDNALRHNTSKSGLFPAILANSGSVTVALPDLSVSQEIIQDKVVQSSCNQASSNRPQIEATEGFHQEFQPFTSVWCEEELDNLWVGVRRHGKDSWYAMLRDPRLRFSPWRTARDLAEKWMMEQTKLLGSTLRPQDQPSNPVGIPLDSYGSPVPPFMPHGPGFMTRFLTDPMQLSLSNAHLNKQSQGMYQPRPPHNFTSVPGNGTRLFNRRVRAHRKSQRPESTWGRFKVGNQVSPPPRLPTSLGRTSRIDILPSYSRDALHYPHPLPPLPVPPPSAQHLGNRSPFHDKLTYNAIGSSSKNGFHLSDSTTECPTIAVFPETRPVETKPTDPKRRKESINLENDASSEGTISDDDKTRLTGKSD